MANVTFTSPRLPKDVTVYAVAGDTHTPLIRLVFPIFDRHHYHRFPTWGYEGALRQLVMFLDEFFETLDANTIVPGKTDYSYDIIR